MIQKLQVSLNFLLLISIAGKKLISFSLRTKDKIDTVMKVPLRGVASHIGPVRTAEIRKI